MLNFFRCISVLEGLSFLAVLTITLGLVSRDYVFYLGMGHGVLFMVYLVASLLVSSRQGWSLVVWVALFLASLVPFAFLLVEWRLKSVALNLQSAEA